MNEQLTQEQLSELRHDLDKRYKELLEEIRQTLLKSDNERYIELAEQVHDKGEESVADLLSDLNYIIIDHLLNELRLIEQAQASIAQGVYGVCTDCKDTIDFDRLKAEPFASRCMPCQKKHEASYWTTGEPSL